MLQYTKFIFSIATILRKFSFEWLLNPIYVIVTVNSYSLALVFFCCKFVEDGMFVIFASGVLILGFFDVMSVMLGPANFMFGNNNF